MIIKLIIVGLFIAVLLGIGYLGMRKTKNVHDFFLGGRDIGAWYSAFSYGTTYFSAVLFIGFAGKIGWAYGTKSLLIMVGNTLFGTMLAWMVLARPTRRITAKLHAMTMPEFLAARYKSDTLKYFSAFIIFLFMTPYSASVYTGLSFLFEKNIGMSFDMALIFMAGLTAVYLVMGGYHAVNISDFLMGLIMLIGSILMVYFISRNAGGVFESYSLANSNYVQHTPNLPPFYMLVCLVILTSLGPWGMPQMVQKFYAIKSEDIIKKAMIITTIFSCIISFVAYYSGALTHCFFTPDRLKVELGGNFDKLMPTILLEHTPPWLSIIILLLVLSASMSTLAGLVLVSSSAIAIDFYQGKNPDEARKKQSYILMRVLCVVFVIISVVMAKLQFGYIVTLTSLSWGLLAGSFLAPYVYGLFFKKGSAAATWISMFTAIGITAVLSVKFGADAGKKAPLIGTLSMLVPMIVFPVAAIIFPQKDAPGLD